MDTRRSILMLKGENYCITRENLAVHEIIGLKAEVVGSSDKGREKMKGKIIDETKNTFTLETTKGEKIVPKAEAVFEFYLGDEKVIVDGKKLVYRPEDRIKAGIRRGTDE